MVRFADLKRRLGGGLVILAWGVLLALSARAETPAAATDVRILVDISGSMVQTDPGNRRTPALNLLIDSLPDGSRAGIWSFGRYVNLLVDHDRVDAAWRSTAHERIGNLRAIAQRTNLGGVLDDAAYDFGYSSYVPPTDVVLITDGQVDIAPNDGVNQVERDRILDTLIPRYARAGARIHSLALSDTADTGLLEQMSQRTGGVFARVASENDIQRFVLNVLNRVSPGNELPLNEAGFDVDGQVSEVTALILHDEGRIGLRSPDGRTTSALDPRGQQWRIGDGYTLVTVQDPAEGHWQIDGAVGDGSRVSVVSDLNLRWVAPAGSVVLRDQPLVIELQAVDQNGRPIDPDLTGVMDPSLTVQGERVSSPRWQGNRLKAQIPNRYDEGPLDLTVRVDAGTFQRQVRRTVQNRPALSSEVLVLDGGYQWRLYPARLDMDVEGGALRADVSGPNGDRRLEFQRHPSGYFYVDLSGDQPDGRYRLSAEGRLRINGQPLTQLGVAPVTLTLPVSADQPRIRSVASEPMAEPSMPADSPSAASASTEPFVKEPMPEFAEITADVSATDKPVTPDADAQWQETPTVTDSGPNWLTYVLYSLPGLVILAGFFVGYRLLERRSQSKADDGAEPVDGAETASDRDEDALQDIEELDLAAGVETSATASEPGESPEAPLMEEVVDDDTPPTPERTEAPRVDMEDALDTSVLDQEDWGELDANTEADESGEDDLFDISNIDESLSDLEDLRLDEDQDPFAALDDDTDDDTRKD